MNKNKKYLIVSDLDGTLLNSSGELSNETIKTVKEVVKQGHIFCIATGRSLIGSINIYNKLNLNSLMINNNGSFISNPSNSSFNTIDLVFNKEIAINILSNEKVRQYIKNAFLEAKNNIYKLNNYHDEKISSDLLNYYHIDTNEETIINLNNNLENLKSDPYVLLLYLEDDDSENFDKIIYHIKNISPCLQLRKTKLPNKGTIVEVNTIFGDKSMGVSYLSSYYGIPKDRIIAFGDGENDVRMLTDVKYGFAMKNARGAAKTLSRHITKYTNDEDGVAWDLKYFMNNRESIS